MPESTRLGGPDRGKYPRVTVLVCALNEEESIAHVLSRIPEWVYEVIVVDGHSTDGTVFAAAMACPRARVLEQPGRGKGDALRYGIARATGKIIITLDADGQTDPADIPRFVEAILDGCDCAKGTRFRKPYSRVRPSHRILGNWLITTVFNTLFRTHFTDVCSGFNAFRKSRLDAINLESADGLADEPLLNARVVKARLRVVEVPHADLPRLGGVSKSSSWQQGFRAIRTIWREWFARG